MNRSLLIALVTAGIAAALPVSSAHAGYFDNRPTQERQTPAFSATPTQGQQGTAREPGFLLRLSGGLGYATTGANDVDFDLRGVGFDYNFAIGAVVGRNAALHANLFGWAVPSPRVSLAGESVTADDATLSLTSIGLGGTFWLGDPTLYLSPSIGLALLSLEVPGSTFESDPGFALDLALGKEWFVGPRWSLGIAGAVGWHRVPDEDDTILSGPSFGLRFSATFH
ncbi:MAG: hypothetical protein EA398_08965 [Deltaproteobacteria bacterium]|nr:MAG: hypothetical protein EA398_08965 [Deltaproteobacteria bacterium]